MEFEKDAPVSDEQRRLAETKKITLQPTHADVVPEDISDSEIANQHINGQPTGNVHKDIEQEAPLLGHADHTTNTSPSQTRKQSMLMIVIIVGVSSIAIAISLYLILTIK